MSSEDSNDNWDFYFCEIDGKPHSTMVNLSLFDMAPMKELGIFHCIEVHLQHPNPEHGMSTNEEFETLQAMGDLIVRKQANELKYIARQTGDCKRKFYFYGSSESDIESVLSGLSQDFPAYEKTTFNFEDAEWEVYFEDLYPNAIAMNEITNRAVLKRLEDVGDDLEAPRTIDHFVIFDNRDQAKEFEKIVKEIGFSVQFETRGVFKKTFNLLVQRNDSPASLDPITLKLEQLAEGLGGSYNGWGCVATTPSSEG